MNPDIYFKAISKYDENIYIDGETTLEDLNNDEQPLQFYNHYTNQLEWYVPKNPFNPDKEEQMQSYTNYEALKESFNCDDLLLKYLANYATESKTIDRGNYILIINDGDDNMNQTELKFIKTEHPIEVIGDIKKQLKKYEEIGGTDKIIRVVIYENMIMLQAENNGDKVCYNLNEDYDYTSQLIENLSVFCENNNLIYSNLNK